MLWWNLKIVKMYRMFLTMSLRMINRLISRLRSSYCADFKVAPLNLYYIFTFITLHLHEPTFLYKNYIILLYFYIIFLYYILLY